MLPMSINQDHSVVSKFCTLDLGVASLLRVTSFARSNSTHNGRKKMRFPIKVILVCIRQYAANPSSLSAL